MLRADLVREITGDVLDSLLEGGGGSGNWGHKGRPGRRGGSLPTKAGSIVRSLAKSQRGSLRMSGKLWRAARTARNIEVVASGNPMKMLKRLINIFVGRHVVSKMYR